MYCLTSDHCGYTKLGNCQLIKVPMVTTESGLQYKDIKVGGGPSPPVGFQVNFIWSERTSKMLKFWNDQALVNHLICRDVLLTMKYMRYL